jgi:hypothetical protein
MTLKDLLRKKDKVQGEASDSGKPLAPPAPPEDVPEFTFLRTTTTSQEVIQPPNYPGDRAAKASSTPKRTSPFRRHSNAAQSPPPEKGSLDGRQKVERKLSNRLHLGARNRSASTSSVNIPADLPEPQGGAAKGEEEEVQWEKRAMLLAKSNPNVVKERGGSHVSLLDESGDV